MSGSPRRAALKRLGAAASIGLAGCTRRDASAGPVQFWAMGREAEVVGALLPAFRARHPQIEVRVQQLPWSAAHEKLLTAYAGGALPDVCQLGNTWLPEFAALDALEPVDARVAATPGLALDDYFAGILETHRLPTPRGPALFGLPWYVDTRLLFYRADLLHAAGIARPPETWAAWTDAMRAIGRPAGAPGGPRFGALLPLNEPDPLFAFALQQGAVLAEDDTRGAFAQPAFRRALAFYVGLFDRGLAPAVADTQISNVWDEFAHGLFGFYVSGPWNIGEFRRRLPARLQNAWATAPLPGPDGPGVSSAGGASLVVMKDSPRQDAAWALVRFLSEPATMQRFHALTGDLPPRRSAWLGATLANDPPSQAFARQLERLRPAPKIPEWERIFQEMQATAERVVRRVQPLEAATAQLDAWVDGLLEKRRWLRGRSAPARRTEP